MSRLRDRFKGSRNMDTADIPYYPPEQPQQYEQYPYQEEYYQQTEQPPQQQYERQSQLSPNVQPASDKSPLSILDEIKNLPSRKGTHPTIIGGIPVDLHSLEDYIIRISPYNIKTLMRYHNARTLEEIKGFGRPGMKMNSKSLILLILAIGMAVLGIFFIFFMPKIMAGFQGGMGV